MRVVHANKAYWPHVGGVETVVRDLAEGALDRGHDVTVVTADGPGPDRLDGVEVLRARIRGRIRSVPMAPGFPRLLLSQRGDVLHVHEPSVLPEAVLALAGRQVRRRFDRIALSWHSDIVRQSLLVRGFGPLLRRALEMVDVVLVASPNHLTSSAWLAPVEHKTIVVPFGVALERYALTDEVRTRCERFRAELGTPLVLFLGRLVYYKGVDRLVAVADELPDARFALVGTGPLESLARRSRAAAEGRLRVLAPVDEVDKVALLHACDVFVLPSTLPSEAYGIVQVEAMACGKPVVTYDLPTGVTWVNRHAETGLVASLAEKGSLARSLQRLLDDTDLAVRLGAGGRRRVETALTLDEQVGSTLAAYER
ncbi:MAG: glycosyltransferase [Acidimicrobiales bacterium]